jgi:hypothetical protein
MTRRSLIAGLRAAMAVGYVYGILRANVPEIASHFIFDFAAGGLYSGIWLSGFSPQQKFRIAKLQGWMIVLLGWPLLLLFVPIQSTFIQLVGLRGAVWFLPFLLIGGGLSEDEIYGLAVWLAVQNLFALGFASAEYLWGLAWFFPHSSVTDIIDVSRDVAGNSFRIPSSFANPASYSSTMNYALPLLVWAWVSRSQSAFLRCVVLFGVAAGCIGVFLGASRSQAIILVLFAGFLLTVRKITLSGIMGLAILALGIGYVVAQNPRLQRFTSLRDTNYVQRRISLSANYGFIDAAAQYPMGNGLGGGGTSLPYFLRSEVDAPLVIENEYGRIMLELGIPGLCMWLGFLIWALGRKPIWPNDGSEFGKQLAWFICLLEACLAVTGIGLFTAIPGSAIFFLLLGWISSRPLPSRLLLEQAVGCGSTDQKPKRRGVASALDRELWA